MSMKFFLLFLVAGNLDCINLSSNELAKLATFQSVAYSTFATICNSYHLASECLRNKVEGDLVECGVAGGAQIAAMAYVCQKFDENEKKIHLLDSFEGIPLAGPNDPAQPGIGANVIYNQKEINLDKLLVSSNIASCSVDQVKQHMKSFGIDEWRLVYHVGWFQHTLKLASQKIDKICLLRLDGDLYESTKICLEHLYPKVSKGGYVIIDDYLDTNLGCKTAVDEYLMKYNLKPNIQILEGGINVVYWKVD